MRTIKSQKIYVEDFERWNPQRLVYTPSESGTLVEDCDFLQAGAIADYAVDADCEMTMRFRDFGRKDGAYTASKVISETVLRGYEEYVPDNGRIPYQDVQVVSHVLKIYSQHWELLEDATVEKRCLASSRNYSTSTSRDVDGFWNK